MKTLETERTVNIPAALKDAGQALAIEPHSCELLEPADLFGAALWRGGEKGGLGAIVGEVVDDRHESLNGRVQVRWRDAGGVERTLWVPALSRLAIRKADRVLMIVPDNWPEPLVVGVVDGFARRPEVPAVTAAIVELKSDEAVRVRDSQGRDVLEITASENGPNLRLLQQDVNIEMPGRLSFKADRVELTARAGPVIIKASDDVVCQGEMIRLN